MWIAGNGPDGSRLETQQTSFLSQSCATFYKNHLFFVFTRTTLFFTVRQPLLSQQALEHLEHLVPDLLGSPLTTQIPRPVVKSAQLCGIEHLADSTFNQLGLGGLAERVAEHHGGREDGADRVGVALACDIRGGAVDSRVVEDMLVGK